MAHPNFLLNSRTFVIGGTSGIGFAVASGALASGSKVHITSSTAPKLSTKIKELQSFYPGAHVSGSAIDLSNVDTAEANLRAAYLNTKHKSSITLTAGTLHRRPIPGFSAIIGVSGAIEALSRGLAVDLAPIRVKVVSPGDVKTELWEKMLGGMEEKFKNKTLTKELGTPEGAAEAYLFCMRSVLATGQGFKIENGSLLA
ncbi:hypothetical protein DFH06DRAFT_1434826 [Mycena polygramma]|nr:hypothetical protein DFH06DRAFT_1434826 [Mycena polygramma]